MLFNVLLIVFLPLMLGVYSIDRVTSFFRNKPMMLLGVGYLFGFGIIAQWFFLLGAWGAPINAMTINGPVIGVIFLFGLISWRRGFQFQKEIPKDISWA
ncbi:MAG TPA: hypothetical protein VLJ10_05640, partial [Candidatus Bathyarchaeia archaeon]|nr:hypothetical protein [Candidatus Bathyarchaeia archaeon]